MAQQPAPLSRHDLEAKLVKRCWEDEAFRKEFTADPATAFVKYLGMPKANVPEISIHQETAGTWHIVIPVKPANAGELSERDLERVAGGAASGIWDDRWLNSIPGAPEVGISTGGTVTGVARPGW